MEKSKGRRSEAWPALRESRPRDRNIGCIIGRRRRAALFGRVSILGRLFNEEADRWREVASGRRSRSEKRASRSVGSQSKTEERSDSRFDWIRIEFRFRFRFESARSRDDQSFNRAHQWNIGLTMKILLTLFGDRSTSVGRASCENQSARLAVCSSARYLSAARPLVAPTNRRAQSDGLESGHKKEALANDSSRRIFDIDA